MVELDVLRRERVGDGAIHGPDAARVGVERPQLGLLGRARHQVVVAEREHVKERVEARRRRSERNTQRLGQCRRVLGERRGEMLEAATHTTIRCVLQPT